MTQIRSQQDKSLFQRISTNKNGFIYAYSLDRNFSFKWMDVYHLLKLINYARMLFVSVRLTVSRVNLDSLCTLSVFSYSYKGKYLSQISPEVLSKKIKRGKDCFLLLRSLAAPPSERSWPLSSRIRIAYHFANTYLQSLTLSVVFFVKTFTLQVSFPNPAV